MDEIFNLDVDAATAILMVNATQMETRAWRYAFETQKFPLDDQIIMEVLSAQLFSHGGKIETMKLHQAVSLCLNKKSGAVDRRLRNLENVYITQKQDDERGIVWHWKFSNVKVKQAIEKVAQLKRQINKVVEMQVLNPTDPMAGHDLVPEDVYFNVVANKIARESKASSKTKDVELEEV